MMWIKHKKNKLLFCLLFLFCLVFALFLDWDNEMQIWFSRPSGFYDEAFDLKICGGYKRNCRIYYTLDGSVPDRDSYLYSKREPIHLEDASGQENVYSARTDTSMAFYQELIEKYPKDKPYYPVPAYTVPNYPVDKCNVVRAAAIDEDGNVLSTAMGVYFVGFREKKIYENIYVASVVTEPDNLFDYENGVYVTGADLDHYIKTVLEKGDNDGWTMWDANYRKSGLDSEREATVSIFDQDRVNILEENCGIRIQGELSRVYLPKSIGCYARERYSGKNEFSANLFNLQELPHKFVFFAGGNDNTFKLKDYLANTLEQELYFSTMRFIPCALFLDGEYWGMYYITESYNADYLSDHYKVKKSNVIMIKEFEVTEGAEADRGLYTETQTFISENDMRDSLNYSQACRLIDIDSYIDYYAAQIYLARNGDWPGENEAYWRTREEEDPVYGDGKWRWMLYDVNSDGFTAEHDSLEHVMKTDKMFAALFQNEEFRKKFTCRILYIGNTVFSEEKVEDFLDSYVGMMKEPIMAQNRRFYNDPMEREFDENVEDIREFFRCRYDAVWDFLVEHMGAEWLSEHGIEK